MYIYFFPLWSVYFFLFLEIRSLECALKRRLIELIGNQAATRILRTSRAEKLFLHLNSFLFTGGVHVLGSGIAYDEERVRTGAKSTHCQTLASLAGLDSQS